MIEDLSLLRRIPHARPVEIGRNLKKDQIGNETDLVVYGEFANETELAAYKAHELYQESTGCCDRSENQGLRQTTLYQPNRCPLKSSRGRNTHHA
ncbi:Dabb family protein [Bradyrhizobium centrosematis]|uniref:Dabb family protein n=1 Tax=Bradyrhizobium centrosematis TaxID=1300039 RepID=UPI00388E872B